MNIKCEPKLYLLALSLSFSHLLTMFIKMVIIMFNISIECPHIRGRKPMKTIQFFKPVPLKSVDNKQPPFFTFETQKLVSLGN